MIKASIAIPSPSSAADQRVGCLGQREIGRNGADADVLEPAELIGQSIETLGTAGGQHKIEPVGRENPRELCADAGGCAGRRPWAHIVDELSRAGLRAARR